MAVCVHEALKQFTEGCKSTRRRDSQSLNAERRSFRTFPHLRVFVRNRTQGGIKGWQSEGKEAQLLQAADHCPKSGSSPLEQAEVIHLPSERSACHHGGPGRRDCCEAKIRLRDQAGQHKTIQVGVEAKELQTAQ